MTKTNRVDAHADDCRYRILMEILSANKTESESFIREKQAEAKLEGYEECAGICKAIADEEYADTAYSDGADICLCRIRDAQADLRKGKERSE